MKYNLLIFLGLMIHFSQCTFVEKKSMFKLLPAHKTNLKFINALNVSDTVDQLSFEYFYNGAGLAVGDLNNDGLPDIFFAGNAVSCELYLNKGSLLFENVTGPAGVGTSKWCTGVSIVDINDDGLKDIYICVAGNDTIHNSRRNIFFINQGISENGIPTFIDKAAEMGLDDPAYSTMAVFFDYDKDKDIDMFLLTNSMDGVMRSMIRPIQKDGRGRSTDRLYRNNGDGTFSNVSIEAGIVNEGYGLGVGISDINEDGWLDIYCANDFISNDLLYINNQDGTFSEQSGAYFKHFTHNGMGMDFGDINNDGLTDVIVLDMLPPDNLRQKLMLASNRMTFENSVQAGFHPQFLRNTLQLNRGKFYDGKHRFSEISFLSGVHQTDWSWAPLLIDLDNDGWKDILITNGFRKDVTNMDYIMKVIEMPIFGTKEARHVMKQEIMKDIPAVKLQNFVFRNNGDLTFSNKSTAWGFRQKTFSNGAAFADFDNDGDLDLVFNNIDQEVTFYENTLTTKGKPHAHHFLNLRFDKSVRDYEKTGLKVYLYQEGNLQFSEFTPFRGYKSTMDELIHFGLGKLGEVDSLAIQWNDGQWNVHFNLEPNTTFFLKKSGERLHSTKRYIDQSEIAFQEFPISPGHNSSQKATALNDFSITPTLLHSLSHFGPSITIADINMDGLFDLFVSGDADIPAYFLLQDSNSGFHRKEFSTDACHHDTGALFFDVDNDGDPDLYIVSGGYQWPKSHSNYQHRLYINDGYGNFTKGILPDISTSGSCVIAADYDQDGDLDLFVGGRVEGHNYPNTPQSYLLRNEGGTFTDQSDILDVTGGRLGMVTAALWTDLNNDQLPDLIVVGEWMPVTILINEKGKFVNRSKEYAMENTEGWWNSINAADLDNDGDIDYVLGNYGLNSFYKASPTQPLRLYAKDFDHNGTIDPLVTYYNGGESYLVHTLDILTRQIPGMKQRFPTYTMYGNTTFQRSFTEDELKDAVQMSSKMMESVILENDGNKSFKIHKMPNVVQFAPVFGIQIFDLNGDGLQDILMIGNSMHEETIFGFYDASFGSILINKGDFQWERPEPSHTNFNAEGDKRALVSMPLADGNTAFIMSDNGGLLKSYKLEYLPGQKIIRAETDDWYITYSIYGRKTKREFYYGEGFLSASSRSVMVPAGANEVQICKFNGQKRLINFEKDDK
jgi:enediyne biosynthesis protein E4